MATTSSKLGAVIDALYTLFLANAGFADLKLASGNRSKAFLGDEYLVVGVEASATQDYAATGNRYKRELIEVECELLVRLPSSGEAVMTATRTRALSFLAIVEDILRTNKTLGIPQVSVAEVSRYTLRQGFDDKGYIELMSIFITADAALMS